MRFNLDDLIEVMKQIIYLKEANEMASKELYMWREKYLFSLPKYEDKEKGAYIWRCFMSTTAEEFSKKCPGVHIVYLEEQWKKSQQEKN